MCRKTTRIWRRPVDNGGVLAQNEDTSGSRPSQILHQAKRLLKAASRASSSNQPPTTRRPADTTDDLVTVTAVPHHTRFLRVANITGGKLNVYLQYYTEDENGDWDWSPDAPNTHAEPFALELDPNEAADITDGDWRVNAAKVRIWAKSDDGKEWNKFKTVDLELVPEKDAAGMPTYLADNEETFCFTIK